MLDSTVLNRDLRIILGFGLGLTVSAITFLFFNQALILYGDAESHLNIAKRVTDSLTPGLAQLGGIWLPIPHLMLLPFTVFEPLWRSGLAGSIVSGISYIVSAIYLFKITYLLTSSRLGSYIAAIVYLINPNILYLQATAMTEIPYLAFFLSSLYYFLTYLQSRRLVYLIFSAGFTLLGSLTRYDGWFLILVQAMILGVSEFFYRFRQDSLYQAFQRTRAYLLLFATMAFMGVVLWLAWDYLILGDPLYFTNSEFSAKSQQQGWLARGELPAIHNLPLSVSYYLLAAYENIGRLSSLLAVLGIFAFLVSRSRFKLAVLLMFATPFFFNIITLYLGQSVLFLPGLTPHNFEWQLFNARYGALAVPTAAFLIGSLVSLRIRILKFLPQLIFLTWLVSATVVEQGLYHLGYAPVLSYQDAKYGLSSSPRHDAEIWLSKNYDHGLVLFDDYARTVSIIHSGLPMDKVVYVGTKPYWQDALKNPEQVVDWIILQESDSVWQALFKEKWQQDRLYRYYTKMYESPEVLIFRRNEVVAQYSPQ